MAQPGDRIRLVLRWPDGQRVRSLWALRATADYYGWTNHFEVWRPKTAFSDGRYQFFQMPCSAGRGKANGGRQLRISRAKSAHSNPAGLTNKFMVSNSIRKFDLAELAHFTQGDWTWMEDLSGKRLSREHWAHIYAAETPRIGRGLVLN